MAQKHVDPDSDFCTYVCFIGRFFRNINIKGKYGFIELDEAEDAEDAVKELDGKSFNGGRYAVSGTRYPAFRIRIGSGFSLVIRSGSRRAKMTLMFWSAGCYLLSAEGFFCNLDVLFRGLGIGKLVFDKKKLNFFSAGKFFPIFGHENLGSESVFSLKGWLRIQIK
jgi:hypothetical protein